MHPTPPRRLSVALGLAFVSGGCLTAVSAPARAPLVDALAQTVVALGATVLVVAVVRRGLDV